MVELVRMQSIVRISEMDFSELITFAKEKKIDLNIVGPEEPIIRWNR